MADETALQADVVDRRKKGPWGGRRQLEGTFASYKAHRLLSLPSSPTPPSRVPFLRVMKNFSPLASSALLWFARLVAISVPLQIDTDGYD